MCTQASTMESHLNWDDDERSLKYVVYNDAHLYPSPPKIRSITKILKELHEERTKSRFAPFPSRTSPSRSTDDEFDSVQYCSYQKVLDRNTWVDDAGDYVAGDYVDDDPAGDDDPLAVGDPASSGVASQLSPSEPVAADAAVPEDIVDNMIYRKFCYT